MLIEKITNWFKNKDGYIYIILLIMPFVFFARLFFQSSPDRLYLGSDFVHYFAGFYYYVERLREFSFPLWDPYVYQGLPFFARMDFALLYPINFLWAAVGALFNLSAEQLYLWYEAYPIFHLSLAGIFCYLFSRNLGLDKYASFLAGVIFMLSGSLLISVNAVPIVASLVWLPLIMLFYRKSLYEENSKKSLLYSLFTVLVITLSHFAGYFQVSFFYNCLFVGLFFLYWAISQPNKLSRNVFRKFGVLIGICGLSLLLYSIVLLPAFELTNLSNRKAISFDTATFYGVVKPLDLTNILIPNALRYVLGSQVFNLSLVYGYFGVLPLLLFFIGVFNAFKTKFRFFILTFFLFLLASLGGFTGFYDYVCIFIPGIDMFRNINKMLYLSSFSLAILAAWGYNFLTGEPRSEKIKKVGRIQLYFFLFSGFAIISYLFYFYSHYSKGTYPNWNSLSVDSLFNSVFIFILFGIFSLVIIYLLLRLKELDFLKVIIIIFIFFDLATFNKLILSNNSSVNPAYYFDQEKNGIYKKIKEDADDFRVKIVNGIFSLHYAPEVFSVMNSGGYSSFILEKTSDNLLELDRLDPTLDVYAQRNADIGVKYFISAVPLNNPQLELVQEDVVDSYNNKYYYSYGGDAAGIVNKNIGEKVYLYKNRIFHGMVNTSGDYKLIKFSPEHITIQIDSPKQENVVFRINDYPGWEASINSNPVAHESNKTGFISLNVPEGHSEVSLKFFPKEFYKGMALSAFGILIFIFGFLKVYKPDKV